MRMMMVQVVALLLLLHRAEERAFIIREHGQLNDARESHPAPAAHSSVALHGRIVHANGPAGTPRPPSWRSGLHRRAIRINHPPIDADRPLYSERPQGAGRPSAPAARRGRLLAPRRLATGTTDADAKCSHTPTSSSAAPATMPPSPAHRPGRDAAQRTPFPSPPEPSRRGARSRRAGESLGPNPPSPGAIGGGEGCSSARTPLDRPPGRSRVARSPLAAGAASPALIRARARAITHLC